MRSSSTPRWRPSLSAAWMRNSAQYGSRDLMESVVGIFFLLLKKLNMYKEGVEGWVKIRRRPGEGDHAGKQEKK